MNRSEAAVPVHVLSGFLGSGKTTLLSRVIDYYQARGLKAAVIMNELGEVNLDGQIVGNDVPMAELLGGCICCTSRGDLGLEIKTLLDEHQPDVIIIESTGAANPMEIIDGVTGAAIYARIDLRTIVTVVDGPGLIEQSKRSSARTFRLMLDQIRCATHLVVNKADKLEPDEQVQVETMIRELNKYAPVTVTTRCEVDMELFEGESSSEHAPLPTVGLHDEAVPHECGPGCHHGHAHEDAAAVHAAGDHASHEHVMAVTYYFRSAVDSSAFEAFMKGLPEDIYRAKGILSFTDTSSSRFLFQYAYGEIDVMKITPQGPVNDVAVFIGEHFSKEKLLSELEALEAGAPKELID
jgi:G3E family GTPase